MAKKPRDVSRQVASLDGKPTTVHGGLVPKTRSSDFLAFSPPSIGAEEIQAVVETLRSGWLTTGPRTHSFEQALADFLGVESTLALSSCTAALHLALAVSGIGQGDEVITTPLTFAATANVVEHLGARVVFADVEEETLNLDPEAAFRMLSPRTRALVPVHYAGHPAELDPLNEMAQKYQLLLLEDAAHAINARYRGRLIGSSSNPVAFSFYATKNLSTIEGGLLTGSPDFLERARMMSLHGMSRNAWRRYDRQGNWSYEVVAPGFKYNMTDVAAAIGLVQLGRLQDFQDRRTKIARLYEEGFADLEALETPHTRPHVGHAWHLYPLRIRLEALTIDRDRFIEELKQCGIGVSVHFIPLHLQPYYRERYRLQPDDFPVAYRNYLRLVSLPLHPLLTDQDVADVIGAVRDVVARYRR